MRLLDALPIFGEPLGRLYVADRMVPSLLFFVVFFHQYQVTKTPRAVPSTCTDDLGCNFGDTCGDGACHDNNGVATSFTEMDVDGKVLVRR